MGLVLQNILMNIPLVLCLLAGVALLVAEVFVPGFGLPGISGLGLIVIGLIMAWRMFNPVVSLAITLFTAVLAVISITVSLKSAASGKISRSPLFLRDTEYSGGIMDERELEGKTGQTVTVLNPVGFAEIDGKRVNVISEGEYLEKGVRVKVILEEGNRIVVTKL